MGSNDGPLGTLLLEFKRIMPLGRQAGNLSSCPEKKGKRKRSQAFTSGWRSDPQWQQAATGHRRELQKTNQNIVSLGPPIA